MALTALSVCCIAQATYPYPSARFSFYAEKKLSGMSYMDVQPSAAANGKTLLLFHGKNFNGYYWKNILPLLAAKGYRILVPDLPGWGKSDKPDLHYSFHLLASIQKAFLDSLQVSKVMVIGHSMGGMLAVRFCLMYPQTVSKLVLEDPIGLEDYKTFVPYQSLQQLYNKESKASYASYKQYQQGYYPVWKPEYEQYVAAQAAALSDPDFPSIAWVNAITYQMIYEQPVVYELNRLALPVLLIIGQEDRTIVGKDQLTPDQRALHGQYPVLGREAAAHIPGARLLLLPGIGHIPHVQDSAAFIRAVAEFL